ncbi:ABC transporter substrate-binding protein [Paenibacillus solisilvae]|uniref:ABC transporter substrate-binding protein n=1 Tax=Paenibacillus solisilvae TaxID=2486751 RepID=A0ABW0W3P4_9BACL
MKKILVLVSMIMIIGLLAACGQSANSNKPASQNTAGEAAEGITPEVAAPENTSTDTAASAPDFIVHAANAKIASMSIHITSNLLALGITPIGSVVGGDVKDFLPHVADLLKGATKYGTVSDPDMEALLASKPDYIYLDEEYSGKDLSKFEKIAPTIVVDMNKGTWRDHLKLLAQHVGKEKEADAFIQDYATKAERVQTLVHNELGADARVMAIRMTAKELRVMSTGNPVGPIMFEDLKLKPAVGVEKIGADKPFEVISKEVLPDFDADAIFVIISVGSEAKSNFEEMEKNAVWQNLKAVKNKHVYILDGQRWLDYSSMGQSMALDDAEKLFTK